MKHSQVLSFSSGYLVSLCLLGVTMLPMTSQAEDTKLNPISNAYVKELSFLKAQKKTLQHRRESYQAGAKNP